MTDNIMSITRQQATQSISDIFAKRTNVRDSCLSILDYLCVQPEEKLGHMSFGDMGRASGTSDQSDIAAACQFLCGATVPVLDAKFEFDDGSSIYPLSHDDARQALDTGVFQHPGTGEMVDNFLEKIILYFSISDKGLAMRRSNNNNETEDRFSFQ